MNSDTYSVECAHGFHAACAYEDCCCECHASERYEESRQRQEQNSKDGIGAVVQSS